MHVPSEAHSTSRQRTVARHRVPDRRHFKYHRHKVCQYFGEGERVTLWVGYLKNTDEIARTRRRVYIIRFPDNPDAPDEKWSASELATGLALAQEKGVFGLWRASDV